ncbi:hypothetical protein QBC38DRAFT_529068 [Podospora fimiseda]|uniref:Uncharacterized protein n=1 Tax=Podospora fimiseda TaxID=252190 RepID=A0AAN7BN00_9PEZI|nr:hypothetical protein QBC38DRAFT_529068 [Podospora fimiseda]
MLTKFLITALFAALIESLPVEASTRYEKKSCQIIGDADIYGIGVRVGYYLTWFAGVISFGAGEKTSMPDLLNVVNVVFFAVIVTLFLALQSFSVIIMTQFTEIFQRSWGGFMTLTSVHTGLLPWLYWVRIDQGRKMDCPSVKMWIFAPFDFYNPHYIRFNRVVSIVVYLGAPFLLGGGLWLLITGKIPVIPAISKQGDPKTSSPQRSADDDSELEKEKKGV